MRYVIFYNPDVISLKNLTCALHGVNVKYVADIKCRSVRIFKFRYSLYKLFLHFIEEVKYFFAK